MSCELYYTSKTSVVRCSTRTHPPSLDDVITFKMPPRLPILAWHRSKATIFSFPTAPVSSRSDRYSSRYGPSKSHGRFRRVASRPHQPPSRGAGGAGMRPDEIQCNFDGMYLDCHRSDRDEIVAIRSIHATQHQSGVRTQKHM